MAHISYLDVDDVFSDWMLLLSQTCNFFCEMNVEYMIRWYISVTVEMGFLLAALMLWISFCICLHEFNVMFFQEYIAKSVLACSKICIEFTLEKLYLVLKRWCIGLIYSFKDVDKKWSHQCLRQKWSILYFQWAGLSASTHAENYCTCLARLVVLASDCSVDSSGVLGFRFVSSELQMTESASKWFFVCIWSVCILNLRFMLQ